MQKPANDDGQNHHEQKRRNPRGFLRDRCERLLWGSKNTNDATDRADRNRRLWRGHSSSHKNSSTTKNSGPSLAVFLHPIRRGITTNFSGGSDLARKAARGSRGRKAGQQERALALRFQCGISGTAANSSLVYSSTGRRNTRSTSPVSTKRPRRMTATRVAI